MNIDNPTRPNTGLSEDRWKTILDIWRENQWLYAVVGFFAGLLAFPLVQTLQTDAGGFLQNLVPESIGIAFTVFIIDRLATRRAEKALIDQFVRDVRSGAHDFVHRAVNELRHMGLLEKGASVLQGKNLSESDLSGVDLRSISLRETDLIGVNMRSTNLEGADLSQAELVGADLSRAFLATSNLGEANLDGANLGGAELRGANLAGANLESANLTEAGLEDANLQGADLDGADLSRANLKNASLSGAFFSVRVFGELYEAHFDEMTILPDGTAYDQTLGLEQLLRFGVILNYDLTKEEGKDTEE